MFKNFDRKIRPNSDFQYPFSLEIKISLFLPVLSLSSVRTYLPGTVLQWCRLFKLCPNLPARHCVTVVQAVKAKSETTCRALCCRGADCISCVGTYLPGTLLQWCRLFKRCQNLPAGHCVTVCRLFKQCQNLPAGHCVTSVQTVYAMSEPTCRALCYRGAGCLSSVRTYLLGTRFQ